MIFQILLVFLHAYTIVSQQHGDRVTCLVCSQIHSPADCQNQQLCHPGEICHTEEYVTDSGVVMYDMRCKHREICTDAGYMVTAQELQYRMNISSAPVVGRKRFKIEAHLCQECCDGQNCNRFLCHNEVGLGLGCLSCYDVANLTECNHVEPCEEYEVCYAAERITDQYELRYDGGCIYQEQCEAFVHALETNGVSMSRTCFMCCNKSYCNNYCSKEFTTTPTTTPPVETSAYITNAATTTIRTTTSIVTTTTATTTTITPSTTTATTAPTTTTTTTSTITTTTTTITTTFPTTTTPTTTTTTTAPTTTTTATTTLPTAVPTSPTTTTMMSTTTGCPTLPSLTAISPPQNLTGMLSTVGCGGQDDIYFLVDSSEHINDFEEHEFALFVKSIADVLHIGDNKTRLGYSLFNTHVSHYIPIFKGNNPSLVSSRLSKLFDILDQTGNKSRLGHGIQSIINDIKFHDRTGAKKYVVILTHENIEDIHSAVGAAHQLKNLAEVFLFGIGGFNQTLDNITNIASSPSEKHLVRVDYVEGLVDILEDILLGHCKANQQVPVNPCWDPSYLTSHDCHTKEHITFILDQSAHTYRSEWSRIIQFIDQFVNKFNILPYQSRISMMSYGDNLTEIFRSRDFSDKTHLIHDTNKELNSLNTSGDAFSHLALEKTLEWINTYRTQVAVIFTNGGSKRKFATYAAAMELHRKNVEVFVVGLGHDVDPKEQMILASDPDAEHILSVDHVDVLLTYLRYIATVKCQATTPMPTTTTTTPAPPTTTVCPTLPTLSAISTPTILNHMLSSAGCGGKDDVMFLVDSSRFINDFEEREFELFAKGFAASMDIGPDKARFGYTYFNNVTQQAISLTEGANADYVSKTMESLVHKRGLTNNEADLGKAIHHALHNMHSQSRSGSKKYLVIFTQDNIRNISEADNVAAAKMYGVEVFVVAVGRFLQTLSELKMVASHPTEKHFLKVDYAEQLGSVLEDILLGHCRDNQTQPIHPCFNFLSKLGCGNREDIALILDQSTNTGSAELAQIKVFIDELVKQFDVSPNSSRIGLMSFNSSLLELVKFQDFSDRKALLQHIGTQLSGITTSGLAFTNMALDKTLEWYQNSPPHTVKVAVIFTNGGSVRKFETLSSAMELHRQNVTVFVVGVGHTVDLKEQMILATDPDVEHVLNVDNVAGLLKYLEYISVDRCQGPVNN